MSVGLVLCLVLSLVIGIALSAPYFEVGAVVEDDALELPSDTQLLDSKERLLRALKDLEQDFSMGKIDEKELSQSRNELSLELAEILKKDKRS